MCPSHRHSDISRRGFAGMLTAGAGVSLLPLHALAQFAPPETLCVMCIDYRFVDDAVAFFDAHVRGVALPVPKKSFDLVAVAGASLAAYVPQPPEIGGKVPRPLPEQAAFAKYAHTTITKVIVLDHRGCGAYKEVFGVPPNRSNEKDQHLKVARQVQPWFTARSLAAEFWLWDDIQGQAPELLLPPPR
jgi:hypothetical protein